MRASPTLISPALLGAAALALLRPVAADPAGPAALPVTRVTLYTSGVGYFERGGAVDGDATRTLLFPTDQVNDVLKSLVLLDDGGGQIRPVTYAAQDPVGRQLQAFSLDLSDNPDRATLLNRLRGADVAVTTTDTPPQRLAGTVIGVETQTVTLPNNGGTTQQSVLNLMDGEGGLHALPLGRIADLRFTDPALAAEMRQALRVVAQGRDANKRPVTLAFAGRGHRSVRVGYLTQAPLWQTSYRLVLGPKPQLQGWALVQNTGQDDWDNVSLSLVSGRPISFIQDLYTPLYLDRPTVAPRVAASPTPQAYNANLQAEDRLDAASKAPAAGGFAGGGFGGGFPGGAVAGIARASAAPPPAPARSMAANAPALTAEAQQRQFAASVQTAGAQLGTALFRYDITVPVSVPRRQSAMIPFVAAPITAESVAIYNPTVQADHPLTGARLKNTTGMHLMGGPLTVFDAGRAGNGYVGDALIDDTEPGQTRLLSYAVEQAIDADTKPGPDGGQVVSIVISRGVLEATRREERPTVYTFKNNGAQARTVVVEHPDPGADWKLIAPATATERTASVYRFDVPVPAGAHKTLTVRLEHPETTTYGLTDADLGTLVVYARQGEASAAVKAALEDVIARRRRIADTQAQIGAVDAQAKALSEGQARIRDNMKALDKSSALYKRYVGELDAQETRLQALQTRRDSLDAERSRQRADLDAYVSRLTLS